MIQVMQMMTKLFLITVTNKYVMSKALSYHQFIYEIRITYIIA